MAMAMFINPLPTLNKCCKFNNVVKTPFSSTSFSTLKQSVISYKKPLTLENRRLARSIQNGIVSIGDDQGTSLPTNLLEQDILIDDDGVSLYQSAGEIHLFFNRLSKWVVAVVTGGLVLLRRDPVTLWAANGIVLNHIFSTVLKRILKQDRPFSHVRSGPGMPSSHAQSIFCAVVFVIQSVVEWQGLNGVTAVLSVFVIILASYFSWLRVMLHYHTTNQILVGAILGSAFSLFWFRTWGTIVYGAYNSSLWVRILIFAGAIYFYLNCISDFILDWKKEKR